MYVRTDQRGQGRLRIWAPSTVTEPNRHADIGAFEYQPPVGVESFAEGEYNGTTFTVAAHSRVNYIVVTFDEDVTFTGAGGVDSAIQLTQDSTGTAVTLQPSFFDNLRRVTLTFAVGGPFVENDDQLGHPSLKDGRYTLTILGGETQSVNTSQFIDGAANGTAGSDFKSLDGSVYRLFGDSNDNRSVETADLIQFRLANGGNIDGNTVIFDFDGDGTVSFSDFIQFRLRFGASI